MNLLLLLFTSVSLSYATVPLNKISSDCKDSKCFIQWSNDVKDSFNDIEPLADGRIPQYKVLEYIQNWFAGLSSENRKSVIKTSYPTTQEFMLKIHKKRLESELKEIEKRVENAKDKAWIIQSLKDLYFLKSKGLGLVNDLILKVEKRNEQLIKNKGELTAEVIKSQEVLSLLKGSEPNKLESNQLKYLYDLALLCPASNKDIKVCYEESLNDVVEYYDSGKNSTYIKFLKDINTGEYKFSSKQKTFLKDASINSDDTEAENYTVSQTNDLSYLFNKVKGQGDTQLCESYALASLIEGEYFSKHKTAVDISQYYLASTYYKQFNITNKENFSSEDIKNLQIFEKQGKDSNIVEFFSNKKLFTLNNYGRDSYLENKDIKTINPSKVYLYKNYHIYNRYNKKINPEKVGFKFIKRIIDSGHPLIVNVYSNKLHWYEDWEELILNSKEDLIGHSFLVVGYGTAGLNTNTLEYEPYLIVRDSVFFRAHYKLAMAAIATRLVWIGILSDVSEVTVEK